MKQYCQMTPLHQWTRYNHAECGDTRGRLYVKRYLRGWLLYCHNCDLKSKFIKNDGLTPSETLRITDKEEEPAGSWWVPKDLNDDIPIEGLMWLDQYGIGDTDIDEYQFKYSPYLNRLVMPVLEGNQWVYWQGRNLGYTTKGNPKYLNVTLPGRNVVFKVQPYSPVVVLVEDILSAIKVGRVTGAYALLGSYLKDSVIGMLQDKAKIFLWLDSDKYDTAYKYYRRLSSVFSLPVKLISTKDDPKSHTPEEIRRIIWDQ